MNKSHQRQYYNLTAADINQHPVLVIAPAYTPGNTSYSALRTAKTSQQGWPEFFSNLSQRSPNLRSTTEFGLFMSKKEINIFRFYSCKYLFIRLGGSVTLYAGNRKHYIRLYWHFNSSILLFCVDGGIHQFGRLWPALYSMSGDGRHHELHGAIFKWSGNRNRRQTWCCVFIKVNVLYGCLMYSRVSIHFKELE